jgi:hypothetical protein
MIYVVECQPPAHTVAYEADIFVVECQDETDSQDWLPYSSFFDLDEASASLWVLRATHPELAIRLSAYPGYRLPIAS